MNKLKIYQLGYKTPAQTEALRDVIFSGLDHFRAEYGGVDLSLYELAYEGDCDTADLEEIFVRFNRCDRPNAKTMRSLSVSDIVSLNEVLYYVESVGFSVIDPDEESVRRALRLYRESGKYSGCGDYVVSRGGYDCWFTVSHIESGMSLQVVSCVDGELQIDSEPETGIDARKIMDLCVEEIPDIKYPQLSVLYFEPGKEGRMVSIPDTLKGKQRLVDGCIEPLYLGDCFVAICNEEGMLNGMPLNRIVYPYGKEGEPGGIFGPFFVMRSDWTSLDVKPEDLSDYIESISETQRIVSEILNRRA